MANEGNKMVIGTNVAAEIKGNILTLTVDLSQENGMSTSGRTIKVGAVGGNTKVMGPDNKEFLISMSVNKK